MFSSIFDTSDKISLKKDLKEEIGGFEYHYTYHDKFGEASLSITDKSGFIIILIKKTIKFFVIILVRDLPPEYESSSEVYCDDWTVLKSKSELLEWVIDRFPTIAEQMIWDVG